MRRRGAHAHSTFDHRQGAFTCQFLRGVLAWCLRRCPRCVKRWDPADDTRVAAAAAHKLEQRRREGARIATALVPTAAPTAAPPAESGDVHA